MKTSVHIRRSILLSVILLIAALLSVCLCACTRRPALADECIRIHIRANSNSEEDQAVKLKVRDKITAFLQDELAGCASKDEAREALIACEQKLVEIANSTLYENDFEYKTSIRLGVEHFPDRDYEGYVFPEGDYEALVINLGSGAGDNWWCVAFPPLCFVPSGSGGEKIVYKSWIKEVLDKLFG